MKVLVIGLNNLGLMPTSERKARVLVKSGKAEVVCKHPYTIKLLYKTGCNSQQVLLGIDTGSQNIGASLITEGKIIYKSEHHLRSTMEKRSLMETRKDYRRGRRFRNTPYRKNKFKHKTKRVYVEKPIIRNKHKTHWVKVDASYTAARPEGWLPPSVQSKVDHHIRIIKNYRRVLPVRNTVTYIEIARFDVARIKDPTIHGEMYQNGRMKDFENINAYVFSRDNYKCKVCGKKAGSKRKEDGSVVKIRAHHIDFKSNGATDNPDRMITVCDHCHTDKAHKPGGILYKWMIEGKTMKRGYRDETFMNILRLRLFEAFPRAHFTYGNITAANRKRLNLPKTHANDAVAIAVQDGDIIAGQDIPTVYYNQVRKKKRSLHEANPRKGKDEPNRNATRNNKNIKSVTITKGKYTKTFHLNDKVKVFGIIGWISGFSEKTAYIKDANGEYIHKPGKDYPQINLSEITSVISHNNNWITYTA